MRTESRAPEAAGARRAQEAAGSAAQPGPASSARIWRRSPGFASRLCRFSAARPARTPGPAMRSLPWPRGLCAAHTTAHLSCRFSPSGRALERRFLCLRDGVLLGHAARLREGSLEVTELCSQAQPQARRPGQVAAALRPGPPGLCSPTPGSMSGRVDSGWTGKRLLLYVLMTHLLFILIYFSLTNYLADQIV